jgi:DNA-damage-inducible protein J
MALKTEMIHARVTPELKAEAEAVLAELGLTPTAAIRAFYRQIVLRKKLPFNVSIPNASSRQAIADTAERRNLTEHKDMRAMFKHLDS